VRALDFEKKIAAKEKLKGDFNEAPAPTAPHETLTRAHARGLAQARVSTRSCCRSPRGYSGGPLRWPPRCPPRCPPFFCPPFFVLLF